MLVQRRKLWDALHPPEIGGDRKSDEYKKKKAAGEVTPSFAKETAKRIGKDERTVRQEMQIAKVLSPNVKSQAAQIGLQKSEALQLTKQRDPALQKRIIERIAQRKAKNVKEAERQINLENEIQKGKDTMVNDVATFEIGRDIELITKVKSASVNAVATYLTKNSDYPSLILEAERILVPGGIIAIMVDPDNILSMLSQEIPENLSYVWILADVLARVEHPQINVQSNFMPVIVYQKAGGASIRIASDVIKKAIDSLRPDEDHSIQLIGKISKVGDVILDPCMSSKLQIYLAPAIGRIVIGFSEDPNIVNEAKAHLMHVKNVIAAS